MRPLNPLPATMALWIVIASTAHAGPGGSDHWTVPKYIRVVGTQNAPDNPAPDPTGQFTVTVRDFANNPIANLPIILDFSGCPDVSLCKASIAGVVIGCVPPTVRFSTDATGQATITVIGGGKNRPAVVPAYTPGGGAGDVQVIDGRDQSLVTTVTAVVYDQEGGLQAPGTLGVNGADLSLLLNDVGAAASGAPYIGRSDYTAGTQANDPIVNGADISAFIPILGRSAQGKGSGTGCADASGPATYCP